MTFNTEFFIRTLGICFRAVPTTMKIAVITLVLSLLSGFLLALVRINGNKFSKALIRGYLSVIRGTPIAVQILVIYSIVPSILQIFLTKIHSSFRIFDLNPIYYAYLVFTLNTAAAMTEIFRSALAAVDRGQKEAAESVGLTEFQVYRRIILPQALASAMPNLCTAVTNLIKATSLAFLMTVRDITAAAKIEAAYGYNYIEAYIDLWIVYLVLCFAAQCLCRYLERRLKRHVNPAAKRRETYA